MFYYYLFKMPIFHNFDIFGAPLPLQTEDNCPQPALCYATEK